MANQEIIRCGLYKPGHNTHFVQANVMRNKERFCAEVELISPISIRVKTESQDQELYYHDAVGLFIQCLAAIDGDIKYAPESNLLYVKTTGQSEDMKGAWFLAYLSKDQLTDCDEVDLESGYFSTPESR